MLPVIDARGLLVGVVTLALLALLGRLLVPSNALEIVLTAIAMLALYAGFESIAEIIHALWKGKGWRAFQKPAAAIAEERGE